MAGERIPAPHDNISNYVDQWMEDTDGEHLSLLGEFGTGKSWFAFKYAHDMVAKYREAQKRGLTRPRVPLLIPSVNMRAGSKTSARC
jgi:predicted NACHT family NTPase